MTLSFKQEINGKPTYFVAKIWRALIEKLEMDNEEALSSIAKLNSIEYLSIYTVNSKLHTIREDKSNRWKADNHIHFVINNRTPQRFQFAPVVKCISVQDIEIKYRHKQEFNSNVIIPFVFANGKMLYDWQIMELAINDGFDSTEHFFSYFNKDFTGKIIHWTDLKY